MNPAALAVLAAITETAKLLQTPVGQKLLEDLVTGGEAVTKAAETVAGKIHSLFHKGGS